MYYAFHELIPFLANVTSLYPLKTSENQMFSGVFRAYKMGTFSKNGLHNMKSRSVKQVPS